MKLYSQQLKDRLTSLTTQQNDQDDHHDNNNNDQDDNQEELHNQKILDFKQAYQIADETLAKTVAFIINHHRNNNHNQQTPL